MRKAAACAAACLALVASAAEARRDRDAETLDPYSFGRTAKWIGLGATPNVILAPDCTTEAPEPGDPTRCITLNAAPALTEFDLRDLARITLPPNATNSMVCHLVSPIWRYQFRNETGVARNDAVIRVTPYFTVESEVLHDPGLIDPRTGAPYGGRFEETLPGDLWESRSLGAGERHFRREMYTRACIAGILSRANLREFDGLSERQIHRFFAGPITIKLHMRGQLRMVDFAILLYGLRLMGD